VSLLVSYKNFADQVFIKNFAVTNFHGRFLWGSPFRKLCWNLRNPQKFIII